MVLRTQKLGEADRIITLLTRENGRVRAVAKGVRRTSSKFGARLEPFSHVDAQFYVGRSLDIVTQVESFHSYGAGLAADYAAYTAGTAMLETAERLTDEEREPAVQQYLLLVAGLRALAAKDHDCRPDPGLLPAALARCRGVGAELRGVRPLRRSRPPPILCDPGRGCGVPGVPPPWVIDAGTGDRRAARGAAGGGLAGRRCQPAPPPARGQRTGRCVPPVAPRAWPSLPSPGRAGVARWRTR